MAAPRFEVRLTHEAERDLEDIHGWLAVNAAPSVADELLDALIARVHSLERFPLRGSIPRELAELGISEFRQVLLGHYRMIYSVDEDRVHVSVIPDGRRDMQALLRDRLVRM